MFTVFVVGDDADEEALRDAGRLEEVDVACRCVQDSLADVLRAIDGDDVPASAL